MASSRFIKRRALPTVLLAVGFVALVVLFINITQRLVDLREAPGDNLTWALSQLEVDTHVMLKSINVEAESEATTLDNVRRSFDNLYSRVNNVVQGPIFAQMRAEAEFADDLATLRQTLEQTVPVLDGSDQNLLTSLPQLSEQFEGFRETARDLALKGISLRSESSDAERNSLSALLKTTAILAAALFMFLSMMLVFLSRQYRANRKVSATAQRANERLKASFQASSDAIIVANDEGIVIDFNRSAEAVFGYTRDEAVGAEMSELIIPEQYRAAHHAGMKRFNETKQPKLVGKGRIEITAIRKNQEEFPIELSIGQAQDHRGTIFVSYLRDITDRLAAEQDLRQARDEALQAEKAKSNFLAVMSHEMRTPLNGLFGTMELLKKTRLSKKQGGYVDIATKSGDILLRHVNDVLDVSRIDEGKIELSEAPFDLRKFFEDIVATNEATAKQAGNSLILELDAMPDVQVLADEHRLRQIAYNLISNALKFTSDGTVVLSGQVETDADKVTTLNFAVADTGTGISEDDKERVFERFYTQENSYDRLASGAGLGLTICKQIAELMGGEISFESEKDEGTIFFVSVPLELSEESLAIGSVETDAELDVTALAGKHVLLVEDNEINRMIVTEMLATANIAIVAAHNGQEAVDIAAKQQFDAIFMDISMPVMNGVDATEIIRASQGPNTETPILALTAHAMADEQAKFKAAGMNICLDKPVSQRTLLSALLHVFELDIVALEDALHSESLSVRLDLDVFGELRTLLDEQKLRKLVSGFEDEISNLLTVLPDHIGANNLGPLAALSHKSVGSAGMIGALSFQTDLRNLEQAAKADDLQSVKLHAKKIEENWPNTLAELHAQL